MCFTSAFGQYLHFRLRLESLILFKYGLLHYKCDTLCAEYVITEFKSSPFTYIVYIIFIDLKDNSLLNNEVQQVLFLNRDQWTILGWYFILVQVHRSWSREYDGCLMLNTDTARKWSFKSQMQHFLPWSRGVSLNFQYDLQLVLSPTC